MGLKASSAHRWVQCPGSYSLSRDIPAMPMDDSAIKGLEEHGIAARILSGENFPDGTEVSDAVQAYVEDVRSISSVPAVEHRVPLTLDTDIVLNCIIDASHYEPSNNTWYIWDYKSGRNPVDAIGNWQMIMYALALMGTCMQLETSINFELRIVQPRISATPSVWRIPAINLRSYRNIAFNAAHEALGDNPTTRTGNHCHYCAALSECFSHNEMAKVAASYQSYALKANRAAPQIAADLTILKEAKTVLDRMILALEQRVEGEIRSGKGVPGWTLKNTTGSMAWAQEAPAVRAMAGLYNVEVDKGELITPKQAIKAGVPKHVVAQYAEVHSGKQKLIKDTDYSDVLSGG